MFKSRLFLALLISISTTANADYLPWSTIESNFKKEKLNIKALSHVKCFFDKHSKTTFQKKLSNAGTGDRCAGDSQITIDRQRVFALIDYTAKSSDRRMFLVDRVTGNISKMAVAHGKYEAGMFNTKLSENKNSVLLAKYFSNELGSNAPSSGYFVAGGDYEGKFGRSLVLHGLENGINDNACERAVVIHKHLLVAKSMAPIMSSGCPMISSAYINHVINLLEANGDGDRNEASNGGVVFIYGPREAAWQIGTCEGEFNI